MTDDDDQTGEYSEAEIAAATNAEAARRMEEHRVTLETWPVVHDATLGDECLCVMCTVRLTSEAMRDLNQRKKR
jgi:hypothetical protein